MDFITNVLDWIALFFMKVGRAIAKWFIDGGGWATVLGAVAVVGIGLLIIRIITVILRRIFNRTRLKGLAGEFLLSVIRVLLYFIYIICIMKVLGIDTSGMVAILAASSLAVSLALQTVLANYASGLILVGTHPFKEGDFIETAGISGTIEKVTLFNTKLRTPDNKIITVPNSSVTGSNVINYSALPIRRVDHVFTAAYGTDIETVQAVIVDVLKEQPLVLHEEGYTVRLLEQGPSSLRFTCRCWVKSEDYWAVFFDVNERMTRRFAEEGIEIPYNKIDVKITNKD